MPDNVPPRSFKKFGLAVVPNAVSSAVMASFALSCSPACEGAFMGLVGVGFVNESMLVG
jgi:hypothetical protein